VSGTTTTYSSSFLSHLSTGLHRLKNGLPIANPLATEHPSCRQGCTPSRVELGNDAVSFSVAFLDKDLGKEEQSVLKAQMCHIIDGLLEERDTQPNGEPS